MGSGSEKPAFPIAGLSRGGCGCAQVQALKAQLGEALQDALQDADLVIAERELRVALAAAQRELEGRARAEAELRQALEAAQVLRTYNQ